MTRIECTRPHIDFSQDRPYSLHDRFRSRETKAFLGEEGTSGKDFKAIFDDMFGTTITRINSRKGIVIWVCPLVVPALQALLRSVQVDVSLVSLSV